MCHYCGCRAMPLIRDYVAEHERASDLGDHAIRAIDQGDHGAAREFIEAMARELERHWKGEENGIFRVMAVREEQYADYVAPLIVEHRELAELLATVDVSDLADQERLRVALEQLTEHISKEEDGLFPASVVTMGGAEWDASVAAWSEAHPGEKMITD
jgi:iron-sulfur cluster repair protein YtfE (RIC family)